MVTAIFASKTDVGRKRDHNEDYMWVDHDLGIYIIADGVGGSKHGEVASKMAAEKAGQIIAAFLKETTPISPTALKPALINSLKVANELVYSTAQQDSSLKSMSTTLLIAVIDQHQPQPKAYISHAGDCRTYRCSPPSSIELLTKDDVWPFTGTFGQKFGEHLTQVIGQEHPVEPQLVEVDLKQGEWLLLCTDGLWKMLDEEDVIRYIHQAQSPPECVSTLVTAANEAGGRDNISVIAIHLS